MNESPDLSGARGWMEKAEHDLRNAEHTLGLDDDDCPFDTACFHAQQCVEKCFKALLVLRAVEFPRTHDVAVLLRLAAVDSKLDFSATDLAGLNRYAVEARYPGDWDPIARAEAEAAVAVARRVRDSVRSLIETHAVG